MRGNVEASTMNNEAGIYVQAMINGSLSKMLIDTGAQLTLISKRMYDLLNHNSRPKLQESAHKVFNASGGILIQYGKAEFCISVGNSETLISAIVTDITVDGILGLDFLKKENGVINLQSNTLQLNG
jgi:predicted aspartyl protease